MESSEQLKNRVLETIEKLNVEILKNFIELKREFESSHISNSEISNKLKVSQEVIAEEWKPTFEQSVNNCLKELIASTGLEIFEGSDVSITALVKELTKIYGLDQEYIEKVKCLNSSTEMIKEYIRIKAIKDPTTAVIEIESNIQGAI